MGRRDQVETAEEFRARKLRETKEHERRCAEDPVYMAEHEAIERERRIERSMGEDWRMDERWDMWARHNSTNLPRRHVRAVNRIAWADRSEAWKSLSRIWSGDEQVILTGPEGSGKTTAMVWAGICSVLRCRSVQYVPVTLFSKYAKNEDLLRGLLSCRLLLLDECHRMDALPDWITSVLIGVIDARYYDDSGVIMAGTLPPDRLAEVVGMEVVKRFEHRIFTTEKSYRK